jgi:hypothetical protein
MALLTLYMLKGEGTLAQFLDKIFANMQKTTVMADENEKKKWAKFFALYRRGLATAKKAGETW